jgi:hypothetical protein
MNARREGSGAISAGGGKGLFIGWIGCRRFSNRCCSIICLSIGLKDLLNVSRIFGSVYCTVQLHEFPVFCPNVAESDPMCS